tara:strand:- start:1328 stop:2722 length:1395 start_codon:yes stop_codon:yes gene_type:complete
MAFGGAQTELYSEVLAQISLAFSVVNNKAMTVEDFLVSASRNFDSIKSLIVTQRAAQLNSRSFISQLIEFSTTEISKGYTWADAQGKNMFEVKNQFNITSQYKIYNDKLYGGNIGATNPYTAFLKAGTGAKPDKWNPADIWVINREGISSLIKMNRKVMFRRKISLNYANQFFMDEFSNGNIIPISLKKPHKSTHIDIINSNEFATRLVLNERNIPTVEYTMGNKDVKINFTIETIKLDEGQKASTARRNPDNIRGTVVEGSQKHIRLKYHVDNKKLELEYTQTRLGESYAAAKMGNIGATNFQNIIDQTSKQGVYKLNDIQRKYNDIDIKTDPWFNSRQLGVVKARHSERVLEPHYDKLADYVRDIWSTIDSDVPNFSTDRKGGLDKASGLWSKARAGELAVAVNSIENEVVQRRVIQNLFEAAASISYVTGLNKEEQALEDEMMKPSPRRVTFNAGVYVKVF